jgi:Undecaprenyl-phosphate glucose phosphotransferase
MLIIIDLTVITLALILAWIIRFETTFFGNSGYSGWGFIIYMMPLFVILPIYLILYYIFDLYQAQRTRSIKSEVLNLIKANFVGVLVLISFLFIFELTEYSRYVLATFITLSLILSITERLTIRLSLRLMRSRGYNIKHILILGAGPLGKKFAQRIKKHPYVGYHIIGFLDDNVPKNDKIVDSHVIGKIEDLEDLILKNPLDNVIITLSAHKYNILNIVDICEKHGVKSKIIPDFSLHPPNDHYKDLINNIALTLPSKPYYDKIDDIPILDVRYVPLDNNFKKNAKRIFDVILAALALLFLSPLIIFTAIIIKITSPGPIIFKQERVGYNRQTFMMYKFRSMKVQYEENKEIQWTKINDPRITTFGSIIRKTSIDEFPQFFNILKGDMSLIGPRPERPIFVEKFREEIPQYMIKHYVRPGMSGWAQVNGLRGNTSIKKRIEYDIYYVENWTFILDLKIFILTIIKGFIHKNAY